MFTGLDNLLKALADTLKTAPDFYADALQPTVREIGKFVARIPRTVNSCFFRVDKWNRKIECIINEPLEIHSHKTATTESLDMHFINSKGTQNSYNNSITKMVPSKREPLEHSYVYIVTQITLVEYRILKFLSSVPNNSIPLIAVAARDPKHVHPGHVSVLRHATPHDMSGIADIKTLSNAIDNLIRYNLVTLSAHEHETGYQSIYNSKQYQDFQKELKTRINPKYPQIGVLYHGCCLSDDGTKFLTVCTPYLKHRGFS